MILRLNEIVTNPYIYLNVGSADISPGVDHFFKLTSQESNTVVVDTIVTNIVANDRYTLCNLPIGVTSLVTNGDFTTSTGWTLGDEWSITNNSLKFTSTGSGGFVASQDIGMVSGTDYTLSLDVNFNSGVGTILLRLGSNGATFAVVNADEGAQNVTLTAGGDSTLYIYGLSTLDLNVVLDNIRVSLPGVPSIAQDHLNGIYDYSFYTSTSVVDTGLCKLYTDPGGTNNKIIHISDNENMESQIYYRPTYEI